MAPKSQLGRFETEISQHTMLTYLCGNDRDVPTQNTLYEAGHF